MSKRINIVKTKITIMGIWKFSNEFKIYLRFRFSVCSKSLTISGNFYPGNLAWIIHESRLLQQRGVMDAAVVLHRKSITTKQMQ